MKSVGIAALVAGTLFGSACTSDAFTTGGYGGERIDDAVHVHVEAVHPRAPETFEGRPQLFTRSWVRNVSDVLVLVTCRADAVDEHGTTLFRIVPWQRILLDPGDVMGDAPSEPDSYSGGIVDDDISLAEARAVDHYAPSCSARRWIGDRPTYDGD